MLPSQRVALILLILREHQVSPQCEEQVLEQVRLMAGEVDERSGARRSEARGSSEGEGEGG